MSELVIDVSKTKMHAAEQVRRLLTQEGINVLTDSFNSAFRKLNKVCDHAELRWSDKSVSQRQELVTNCYDKLKSNSFTQELMFNEIAMRLKTELGVIKDHEAIKNWLHRQLPDLPRWESLSFDKKTEAKNFVYDAILAYERSEGQLTVMLGDLVEQVNGNPECKVEVSLKSALNCYNKQVKPNLSKNWRDLTIDQKKKELEAVFQYLSVECQSRDYSQNEMLQEIIAELAKEGTHVKEATLKGHLTKESGVYSGLEKKDFRTMSLSDKLTLKSNLLRLNRNGVMAGRPTYWRQSKKWLVDGVDYTTKSLYALIKYSEKKQVSYGAFCRRLLQFLERAEVTPDFSTPFVITRKNAEDLISKYCSILPGLIYKITILVGDYAGHVYIGQTQTYLGLRVSKHIKDALKQENSESSRKMYLAIQSAEKARCNDNDAYQVEILAEDVAHTDLCDVETQYIKQYWGDKCLNSHPTGNSKSGSQPSTFVVASNGVRMGITDAIRFEKRTLGIKCEKFDRRVTSHRLKHMNRGVDSDKAFLLAIQDAVDGVDGRKKRDDTTKFKCGSEFLTSDEIREKFNCGNGKDSVESRLSRLGYYSESKSEVVGSHKEYQLDVEPYMNGTIKEPPAPNAKEMIDQLSDKFCLEWSINTKALLSYSQLADVLSQSIEIKVHKTSVSNQAKKSVRSVHSFEELLTSHLRGKLYSR